MFATAAALVTAVFPPSERGRALGVTAMAVYIGLSVARRSAACSSTRVGWRSIFLVNLPIGALVLLWGSLLLPQV